MALVEVKRTTRDRSPKTIENIERRAQTRLRRLERAVQRRVNPRQGRGAIQIAQAQRAAQRIEAKRGVRERRRAWRNGKPRERGPNPSDEGERQFGTKAKGYHIHQREHGLARALTPKEFQDLERKKQKPQVKVVEKHG